MRRTTKFYAAMAALGLIPGIVPQVKAADFDWNQTDSPNDWSVNTNWTPNVVGGPDAQGAFVLINTNITANSTINLFQTGNSGDAIKTVGRLDIGDLTLASNQYTIATGTLFGILNFDNTGNGRGETNAQLNMLAGSRGDTISAPVTLGASLDITNASPTFAMTISGGITSVGGARTINTSTGLVTLSGIIGDGTLGNTVAVVQDGAGTLTLNNANTFTGGLTIRSGTVIAGSNAASLGAGTVTIGETGGTSAATLQTGDSPVYANNIVVGATSTGINTLLQTGGSPDFSGSITLNGNLTVGVTSGGQGGVSSGTYLNMMGAIGGTGNLTLNVIGNQSTTNNTAPSPTLTNLTMAGAISTSGAIINAGTGSGLALISGDISNISSLSQNSATSTLTLSGTNTYSGGTFVNAGILRINASASLPASNEVTVAAGGTLQFGSGVAIGATPTIRISGNGSAYSDGALQSLNSTSFAGSLVLLADATVSSNLATTTLTLSGAITGTDRTLTVTGPGNTAISALATGTGKLVKTGTGTLTLSGTNSHTGLTSINNGILNITGATALSGGGNITFGGGTLQHGAATTTDVSARIVNSTGPISIHTNAQAITYSGGLAASNTGGFTKLGTGTFTLSGTNAYSGVTAVSAGVLAVSASALPTGSSVFLDNGGTLNQGGAFALVQGWINSGKLLTSSTGTIALTGASSENINFGSHSNLMLGASTNSTYTGTLTPSGTTYRLGGGTSSGTTTTLTLSGTNALTGSNSLVVGAFSGTGTSIGNVAITGANNMSGTTTINVGTLTLSGANGGLASSDITANSGTTLALTANTAAPAVNRAASVTLSRGTLTETGNSTANSIDTITGALNIAAGGNSTVTLTTGNKMAILQAGSFSRSAGGTVLFRGTAMGVNDTALNTATSTNLKFTTGPTLTGGTGTPATTIGIIAGAYGDTASNGNGLAATGGLVTYDTANGVRLLSGSEYKATIDDGQSQLDNIKLSQTVAGTATTTLNSNTTVNSLSLITNGNATAALAVTGTGTLTLNSGVIYASIVSPAAVNTTISNAIDLNGKEGIFLYTTNGVELQLSGVIGGTSNGVTLQGTSGTLRYSGAAANTYTGITTVNTGNLFLGKTAGVTAVAGDLVVNTGSAVTLAAINQIADSATVTLNGGNFSSQTETIAGLNMSRGSSVSWNTNTGSALTITGEASVSGAAQLTSNVAGHVFVGGALSLSDGGTLFIRRSNNLNGTYDGLMTLSGGLNITQTATGAYTPINISAGNNLGQSGGALLLKSNVTFTGNSTNYNTAAIDAIMGGAGRRGIVALDGNRTFSIGDGAAAVDLTVNAPLVDGTVAGGTGAGSLTKTGLGTLALTTASTYTGGTTISAGKVVVNSGGSLGTGNVLVYSVDSISMLELDGNSAISDFATLTINTGGVVNLDFSNLLTENVGQLILNGTTYNTGVFDSSTPGGFFSGTGTLTVVPEPGSLAAVMIGAGMLLRRRRARS